MNSKYRKLTEEEIKLLPFELKICYMITPWNISFNPLSISEWVENLGMWHYMEEYNDEKDALKNAIIDVTNKCEFIAKYIK